MKMRMPAIPLITIDPYFSVWSRDRLNDRFPEHWTGARNAMRGVVTVDGVSYCFLGESGLPKIEQTQLRLDAMSTTVVFANESIKLTAVFTSPLLIEDLYYASRPVSYLKLSYQSLDGRAHSVTAKITAGEELVLNRAGEGRANAEQVPIEKGTAIRMGSLSQPVLGRDGDDLRIDWGYFYLAVSGEAETGVEELEGLYAIWAEAALSPDALFAFAYDDVSSILYFGEPLSAYWKKDGQTITAAISEALGEYDALLARCNAFSHKLRDDAERCGGEKYAELLQLAYRQVMAAHKLVVNQNGENLYISKECFSNGCAATVDVTYPSAPLYLRYNPELLCAMLRPVLHFARSDAWQFDFAPHDVGRYPVLAGQVYSAHDINGQMPVEECGNIMILAAALCDAENSPAFAEKNMDLLEKWSEYLVRYGLDPANQLCTDDFAGHLAHNCNLSLKAILGIMGYARILRRLQREEQAAAYERTAREYAASFLERAANPDGSFRLAFDRPGTFSLKYNAVWDRLWKTGLFPESFYQGELARYRAEALPYGVPLDSRERYTKSDWLIWAACFADSREEFSAFAEMLWRAYDTMRSRVPMTDWYYADTSEMVAFRNRTVQGGLFIRLLF